MSKYHYRKSSFFEMLKGGGGGGSINLEKTMVSALHRELQNQVEKLKYKKV